MLIFDLLAVLFSFVVLGEPLRSLVSRYSDVFSDLDVLQILILDIFLGGFLLYIVASIPIGLFDLPLLATLLIVSVIFTIFKALRHIVLMKRTEIAINPSASTITHLVSAVCTLLVFILLLWIELTPTTNIVLGSIDDTSLHSMFVQLLVNNKMLPSTHMPFLPEAIVFPQGHTVFFGLATVLLDWVSAKSVFYGSSLFMALSTFGAYFLGKKISGKPSFGAILAFVTGFVATHPRYLTWGGNALIVAFPFFMVYLSLLFNDIKIFQKPKKILLVEGLLLGYLAAVYLTAFLVIALLIIFDAVFNLATKRIGLKNIKEYVFLLFVSGLVILPNIYKFLIFYTLPGQNIGLPSDITGYLTSYAYPTPLWALENITTQRFQLLNVLASLLIIFGVVALVKVKKSPFEKRLTKIALSTFVVPAFFIFLANNMLEARMVTGAATCVLVFVSLNLLMAFCIHATASFIASTRLPRFTPLHSMFTRRPKITRLFVVSILFSMLLAPFVFYSVLDDENFLTGSYGLFAVTSQEDYDLMLWMKDNLNQTSTRVLVNRYDAGNFIPSVSNLVAIYPFSGSHLSASYRTVVDNLQLGKLNASEYDFMKRHNITHVFVGSSVAYWWTGDHKWYPETFLNNTHFTLVKQFGEAYLFEVHCEAP